MPGFDNSVLYADNVDFSGGSPVAGKVTADGQLLIGSTASPNIKVATLTAGAGITINNSSGGIEIVNSSMAGITWNEVTSTSQAAAVGNGYVCNNASLITVTLPTTAAFGSVIRIAGKGAGGWRLAQNTGETIRFGELTTTSGAGGYLQSTDAGDAVEIVCITANDAWEVISSIGNITVV